VTAGKEYRCDIGTLTKAAGASTVDIAFKIDAAVVGDDGTAKISGPARDKNPANNTAKIVITVAGDTGGIGGGLPVTGVKAGLIGGIGGLALVAGAVLFVMSRRRRVLLVTPADEV
jgi:LPXTG-motif cell wall-anchored protein